MKLLSILLAILALSINQVYSHDMFKNLTSKTGGSCCSGKDDATGDCEKITSAQIHYKQNEVIVSSDRYKASVIVSMSNVQWSLPDGLDMNHVGVWCGKPRDTKSYPNIPVTASQPDANTITYCLFLEPGGV